MTDLLAQHLITTYYGILWKVALKRGRPNHEEDTVSEFLVHLLEEREALEVKAAEVGWTSRHMKNYVGRCCKNFLTSKSRGKDMTARGQRFALEGDDYNQLPYAETLARADGKRAGAISGTSHTPKARTEDCEISIQVAAFQSGFGGNRRPQSISREWADHSNDALQNGTEMVRSDAPPPNMPSLHCVIPVRGFQPSTALVDVARAIEKLPAEQATAFRARCTAGTNGDFRMLERPRTWAEVARITGMSERTAQRRISEAFAAMRQAAERTQ